MNYKRYAEMKTNRHLGEITSEDAGDVMCGVGLLLPVQ
jgi:hypothetical protein